MGNKPPDALSERKGVRRRKKKGSFGTVTHHGCSWLRSGLFYRPQSAIHRNDAQTPGCRLFAPGVPFGTK